MVYAESYVTFESENMVVNILGCELIHLEGTDYNGEYDGDYVAVYYEYTNLTDESKSAGWEVSIDAFQNGIELETEYVPERYFSPEGYEDSDISIRPNATACFYEIYRLKNTTSPIEVEVDELLGFYTDPVECVLSLDGNIVSAETESYVSGEIIEKASYEELEEHVSELELLVQQLIQRIEDLENKLAQ